MMNKSTALQKPLKHIKRIVLTMTYCFRKFQRLMIPNRKDISVSSNVQKNPTPESQLQNFPTNVYLATCKASTKNFYKVDFFRYCFHCHGILSNPFNSC